MGLKKKEVFVFYINYLRINKYEMACDAMFQFKEIHHP